MREKKHLPYFYSLKKPLILQWGYLPLLILNDTFLMILTLAILQKVDQDTNIAKFSSMII